MVTVEKMIAKQISVINLNIIKTIQVSLEAQQIQHRLNLEPQQQNKTNNVTIPTDQLATPVKSTY